ncbi:FtsK/SpoIIIE domain-containing protein, partial [Streptomyces sp. JJ36]|uniref:FtsK/SpoIIIE domain-containing protein n=1 Tax=Streptomyces sp. JJ36 TaxID=2736645 RepID=UPI00235141CA
TAAGPGPAPGTGAGRAHPPAGGEDCGPDPAGVLLTALGPGPELWHRGPGHPEALTVRLGNAHRSDGPGTPVTVRLAAAGSLGLAGPRARLAALARSVLAQLAVLHPPSALEIVLLAADGSRPLEARTAEWGWLGWLPHVRPAHGQDCRLLLAYDRDQAAARTAELIRRLDEAGPAPGSAAGDDLPCPRTLLVVDGDPGAAGPREAVARLAAEGGAAGVHVLSLAEAPSATPASPLAASAQAAGEAAPPFRVCGVRALLSGAVATAVRVLPPGPAPEGAAPATGSPPAAVDGVSAAWAERVARALAPLRESEVPGRAPGTRARRPAVPLPESCRLLDELGLARATPTAVLARWADRAHPGADAGPPLLLGAGPRGPVEAVLGAGGGHAHAAGPPGTGKTELLCSLTASLAAADRPERLGLWLLDGEPERRGGGLAVCADLPHVERQVAGGDPRRLREFAQSLTEELKRRAERAVAAGGSVPAAAEPRRLVVVVDDLDTLVDPALGHPGRPAAGSVLRALEAVARDGAQLGVHLVTSSGRPDRTAGTAAVRDAAIRVELSGRDGEEPLPGRGTVLLPDGSRTAFQAARVTGRIPRTATQRPTVVALDWARAGDPPARRPVRELGNGPTDLALLASAMERAVRTPGGGRERGRGTEPGRSRSTL